MAEKEDVAPSSGLINLMYIMDISGGNTAVARDMVDTALKQIIDFMQRMEGYVKEEKWENLSFDTHKLRSSVRIIGAVTLQNKLTELEKAATAGKPGIPELFETSKEIASEIIKELERQLDKLA